MEVLKFSPEKQRKIWRILSGILHLGNIEFDEVEEKAIIVNEEGNKSTVCFHFVNAFEFKRKLFGMTSLELKIVADLLDFDQKELRDALTSVFIQSLNQTVPLNRNKVFLFPTSQLSFILLFFFFVLHVHFEFVFLIISKAILSRDSLAKHLYELLFNWIVARINKVIGARSDFSNCNFIGILDISGYENLPVLIN
jgi:hypothetical protein